MENIIHIKENVVELKTDINYKAVEIEFTGNLSIKSLLPNDYLVKKGKGKLIILKFNKSDIIEKELFKYYGGCFINYAFLVDSNYEKHQLLVRRRLNFWNNLTFFAKDDGTMLPYFYTEISTNWDKLESDIRNDGYEKTTYIDDGTGTNNKIQRKIKKYPNSFRKDRNVAILGEQHTKGGIFKIKGDKVPYSGYYHIYVDSKKVMTGKMPENGSKELILITKRKAENLVGSTKRRSY